MSDESANSLRFNEKLGYALGDTASNFFFQTFNIFLLYYYTDVFGISAAAVGTLFFVSKLWDALNDPLMGALADRTTTRHGKYRPYLLWMALPYGLMGYLMFANPDLGDTGRLVYAWVTYSLMMMLYTAINVPYSALMGVMTPSSEERTVLASYRFVGAFGGGLLISMLVRPLVQYFGAEDEAVGFQVTMALFAVISVAMFWYTFAATRERVHSLPEEEVRLSNDVKLLLSNRPWLVLFFSGIFTLSSIAIKNAVIIHYFKYYVTDDGSAVFLFFDLTTLFMTSGMLALIVGVGCTKWLAGRFEKKSLMIALSLGTGVTMVAFFFLPADQVALMFVLNIAGSLLAARVGDVRGRGGLRGVAFPPAHHRLGVFGRHVRSEVRPDHRRRPCRLAARPVRLRGQRCPERGIADGHPPDVHARPGLGGGAQRRRAPVLQPQ
jgi:GPH family glycoside/pentoside/hexuronide:cation symporter